MDHQTVALMPNLAQHLFLQVLLEYSRACSFTHRLWLLSYYNLPYFPTKNIWVINLKDCVADPLQKMTANSMLNSGNTKMCHYLDLGSSYMGTDICIYVFISSSMPFILLYVCYNSTFF